MLLFASPEEGVAYLESVGAHAEYVKAVYNAASERAKDQNEAADDGST